MKSTKKNAAPALAAAAIFAAVLAAVLAASNLGRKSVGTPQGFRSAEAETSCGRLRLVYRTESYAGTEYIAEIRYVLDAGSGEAVIGGFSRDGGLVDARGEPLEPGRLEPYLQGLSMDTLGDPLSVSALFVQCETGRLLKMRFAELSVEGGSLALAGRSE